jgi:hypothetical protein
VAVATNALTTLTTVKAELGISVSTYDSLLERYINAASGFVERYVNRKLYWEEDIEEKQPGHGTRWMVLDRTPIVGTPVITYDSTTVDTDYYEVHDANAGILFALDNWIWTVGLVGGITEDPWVSTARKLYTVTYDAGWVTPQQAADDGTLTRNLPYDLEEAVIQMVVTRYALRGKPAGLKSERLLSWSADYSGDTMPSEIMSVLDSYASIPIV